jgi:hypothetical protein
MTYVIIGLKGSDQVLVVDTETLTVSALDAASVESENVKKARAAGTPYVEGVDVAVAVEPREGASAMWYFENK